MLDPHSEEAPRYRYDVERMAGYALWLGPPLVFLLVFMVLPYANVFQYSLWRKEAYSIIPDLNLENYRRIIDTPLYLKVILNSLMIAAIVTISANLFSFPLAYFLAFIAGKHRAVLYFLIIVPLWTSFLLRAYIWKILLGREGVINGILVYVGAIDEPLSLILYNNFSICLTLTYIFIPFVTLPIYTSLEKIDPSYIEASMDLGGTRLATVRRVILPLSLPGIIAGSTITFCLSFGDFVTPTLLGKPENMMISNVIIGQFGAAFDWPFGSALAMVVVAVVLSIVVGFSFAERRRAGQIA